MHNISTPLWVLISLAVATTVFLVLWVIALVKVRYLKSASEREIEAMKNQLQQSEKLREQSEQTFQVVANDALKKSNDLFLQLAKSSFSEYRTGAEQSFDFSKKEVEKLVAPLSESLKTMDEKILEMEKERVGAYKGLTQQVDSLMGIQKQLHKETSHLSTALRTPSAKGRWGELQLKRVVELAGMTEHCDFFTQVNISTDSGAKRPDLVVRLPGNKSIVVDAKAPLSQYLDAIKEENDSKRKSMLDQHATALKRHIQTLSTKSYQSQFDNSPEFVVLFMPAESIFSAALKADPSLIELGADKNVILATPTTLIAMLRSVSYGWKHESISDNAKIVMNMGRELQKRIGDFSSHFNDVGRFLKQSVSSYNRAVGSYDSRLKVTTKRLSEMGLGDQESSEKVTGINVLPNQINSTDETF